MYATRAKTFCKGSTLASASSARVAVIATSAKTFKNRLRWRLLAVLKWRCSGRRTCVHRVHMQPVLKRFATVLSAFSHRVQKIQPFATLAFASSARVAVGATSAKTFNKEF